MYEELNVNHSQLFAHQVVVKLETMLRRPPTRLAVKLDDAEELDRERAKQPAGQAKAGSGRAVDPSTSAVRPIPPVPVSSNRTVYFYFEIFQKACADGEIPFR